MALLASDKGGEGFEPVPAGTYVARCVSVVDLGVQDTPWGGKEKVYIGFEVPEVRVEWTDKDGKQHEGPALIGNRFTLSIHPDSNLGQTLTNWRGKPFTEDERKGFDLFTVLGAPCMISVIHNEKSGKVYANISGVMRLPSGSTCPDAETELVAYTPQDQDKAGNFKKLPEWQQKLVRAGYKMAEGDNTIGSANRQSAPGNAARAAALATSGAKGVSPEDENDWDDWDSDIPF